MPVRFRETERQFREKWLPPDLGERLETIRKLVKHLYDTMGIHPQLKWFTPHGVAHCNAVEDIIHQLIPVERHRKLSESEKFFLLASAWLHDIGMLRGTFIDDKGHSDDEIRDNHHSRSEKYIINNYRQVGVDESEATAFGYLARFHRRRCLLTTCPEALSVPGHGTLRLRLLAAYVRLADALDIDQTRTPAGQYAISLTYDIPRKSKLHWLRSKFILGLDIDVKNKQIAVHLKSLMNKDPGEGFPRRAMKRTLKSIHDLIVQDISDELDTVKDVLFGANLTYFLTVKKVEHEVEFDDQLRQDIKSVLNYFFLIDNPSSSALLRLMLESIQGIVESHNMNSATENEIGGWATLDAVGSFMDEIEDRVLKTRKCHTGLRNFVDLTREKIASRDIGKVKSWVEENIKDLKCKRRRLRYNSFQYFRNNYVSDNETTEYPKFNILLYGYSELVIKALCGFRDAIIVKLVNQYRKDVQQTAKDVEKGNELEKICQDDDGKKKHAISQLSRFALFHKADLERQASQSFRIFICEGQPKNRTAWGGRSIYYDGLRYAVSLAEHGFEEIYITADAIAATLIAPYYRFNGVPKIDFVMVGANGFDDEKFLHSAGHNMVVALASYAKELLNGENPKNGKTKNAPKLVLAVITDKYEEHLQSSHNETTNPATPNDSGGNKKKRIFLQDGWRLRGPFGDEPVRNHVFFTQDPKSHETLEKDAPTVLFYNPREDIIPIDCVDVVITEKAWLVKDEIQEGKKWDGKYIKSETQ